MKNLKFLPFMSLILLSACTNSWKQPQIADGVDASGSRIEKIRGIDTLVVPIFDASYDTATSQASITMDRAYQKYKTIKSYYGSNIIVIYQNLEADLTRCPKINTALKNIQRDINFVDKTVTLTISNVTPVLANQIEGAQCFSIHADTVKKVSSFYF